MEVLTPQLSEAFAKINPLANLVSYDATGGEVSYLAVALRTEGTTYHKTE
eukprot:SAG25_NODE_12707_length_276_cov_0.598870_2_plen_49_part_01